MLPMIQETVTYSCRTCGSINIIRNGTNKCGNAQYHCKDCGAYRVLKPKQGYTAEQRRQVIHAYRERMSLRGVERVFGVCRQTVMTWLEQRVAALPYLVDSLLPAQADDVLEVDEAWSFVGKKAHKRWLWTVLCRRTRQIVAFVIGDRSEKTCQRLWNAIPPAYRLCQSYSDFWSAYDEVFPDETHQSVDKHTGQVAHQERWYNTLRQWLGRYTRKTLAFSKTDYHHVLVTGWFIVEYNLSINASLTS
jgi:IS1 family transposase/DNA-directed RNA polymerase subunit RPC12/RpoP